MLCRGVGFAFALAFSLHVSGCGGCDGGEDAPQFTITDPGSGPTNTASLAPLSVGYRFASSVIDGRFEGPHGPMYRVGAPGSPFGRYYLVTDDGVFDGGGTLRGVLDNPVLVVPATVRLGMTWTARYDGEPTDVQHEVTARMEGSNGAPTRWRIETSYPPMLSNGYVDYIEGLGPADELELALLDPSDTELVPRRPMTLEVLPLGRYGFAQSPSMVRYGTGPAIMMGNDDDEPATCVLFDGTRVLDEDPPIGWGPFTETPGPACVSSNYCTVTSFQVEDCKAELSGYASGALVHADGRVSWITQSAGVTLAYIGSALDGMSRFTAYAQWIGASGQPEVLYNFDNERDFVHLDGDFYEGRYEPVGRKLRMPWQVLPGPSVSTVYTFHEPGATSFLIHAGGMLYTSRALRGSVPSNLVPAGRLSGKLSVLSSEHGTEVLRMTAEGSIDELRVDESGLVVTHLADIPIEAGHAPIGAWRWREQDGSARLVVQLLRAGLNAPSVHLFRTREKLSPGTPVAIHPALKITSGAMSRGPAEIADPWVCWEPSGASAAASWTVPAHWWSFDDVPVIAVDELAGCVAISPPGAFMPDKTPGAIVGTVPNVGRVAITLEPSHDRGLWTALTTSPFYATLTGSGFVTTRHRYSSGGVLMGIVDGPSDPGESSFADQGGNGLWYAEGTELHLIGRVTQHFPSPQGQPVAIQFATAAGGVVVTSGGVWYAVTPTGTWSSVPTPLADHSPCVRMPDGTLCGEVADEWYCQPAIGAEVRSGPLPSAVGGVCETFVDFSDGTVIAYLGDTEQTLTTYRLAASGAATTLSAPGLIANATIYDADGQPWTDYNGGPARLGPDGSVVESYPFTGTLVSVSSSSILVFTGVHYRSVARN